MAKGYSLDLRQRVWSAWQNGEGSQRELARRCLELGVKVDNSNINKAERSSEGIGVRKLPTLAKALETTVDELLAKDAA